MVSFQLIAVAIVATLTTSVVSLPFPGVYIGAAHVGEKPSDTPSVAPLPRALLPRTPVYIGAARVGTAPEYGARKRELAARDAAHSLAALATWQGQVNEMIPILSE